MEEIKVTRNICTSAIFTWGDPLTGRTQLGGRKRVENKDPQNLTVDAKVTSFFYGDEYFLTDEKGKTYVSNSSSNVYDFVSPTIYCGKAVSIAEGLAMFKPGTWQYNIIVAAQKDGIDRISVCANGFVEAMNKDGLTLEEYIVNYSNTQNKII